MTYTHDSVKDPNLSSINCLDRSSTNTANNRCDIIYHAPCLTSFETVVELLVHVDWSHLTHIS